jgi:hypothetical protein
LMPRRLALVDNAAEGGQFGAAPQGSFGLSDPFGAAAAWQ